MIFTISLWIHVKHFIALTKRESVRRIFFCNYRSGKLKRQENKKTGEDLMTSKKKPRDYAKKHTTATSQTCSKMITPTMLNDFGASLRAKEQRVQGWRL